MRRLLPAATLSLLSVAALQAESPKPTSERPTIQPDPRIASYRPTRSLSGELKSTANDEAFVEVIEAWAAAFMKEHPALRVSVKERKGLVPGEGLKGVSEPPALAPGSLHFGPDGWVFSANERDQFEKEHGYKPLEIRVGLGTYAEKGKPHAVGVFVNAQNPLHKLTLAQVDAIFSSTRRRGYPRDIATWSDLGLTGEWANQPIRIYGKKLNNVITAFFREKALEGGAFKDTLAEQENSDAVVAAVARDKLGIAFSGLGFSSPGVKALPLAEKEAGPYAPPTPASVAGWSYPLSRYLYAAVDKARRKPLDPRVEEFLKFILSREGQEVVAHEGFLPLSAKMAQREWAKVH